jgi:hypothetical protein
MNAVACGDCLDCGVSAQNSCAQGDLAGLHYGERAARAALSD